MANLKKQSEGIYSKDLKSGTEVYDKATGGELVVAGIFEIDGIEFETDENGKIVKGLDVAVKAEFLNPFQKGVTYSEFLKNVPEETTVQDYCAEHLTQDEIDFILKELKSMQENAEVLEASKKEIKT